MNIDSYDHEDGVDIYLFDDSYSHPITGNGFGTTSGIGEEPAKLLVAGSRNTGFGTTPLARSHVLSHEMGHVLFLWHTHHGTVLEAGDPDQCSELVDGSNAYLCGDYIFDTPADPNISYNVDEECEWQGSGVDANNDPYTPDELNIMSYTHPLCMEYFTSRQAARMKTALGMLPHLKLLSKYNYQLDPCATFQSGLNFYPNPAAEILHLDLREKPIGLYTYYLYNNYNVLVLSGQSQNILQTLDTSSLEEGVYYLHFYDINELIIKQIIINH